MKLRSTLFSSLVAAVFLLFASSAFAQESPAAPAVKSQGSASYISGGVTGDERDAMKPLAKDYNLRMAFALSVGNYVADVKINVQNAKGKTVLDVVSDGPWLYAKLPAGKYKVIAEYEGKAVTKSATISANKGASLNFVWPGVKEKYDN
jgi:hypothetical protein